MDTPPQDDVPVRRLRARRDSAPVPTELVDAANPLAIAFHASVSLGGITDVFTLGNYWGAGRRKAREAREVLVAHGLWIKIRPDVTKPAEIRTVETRATDRDIAELALECPSGARISTAGCTWVVDASGRPVLEHGELPPDFGLFAGQDRQTETGPTSNGRQTETGPFAGQDRQTETGPTSNGRQTETGPFAGQDRQTETGPTSPARYVGDTSGISGREIPEVDSATPPADAGAGDAAPKAEEIDWARLLVRALPWQQKGRKPTLPEAGELAENFRLAASRNELTEPEIREHALAKLAAADPAKSPVRYVIGAFQPQHLDRLYPAGAYEPLSESPLSLPSPVDTSIGATDQQTATETSEAAVPTWCGECNQGDPAAKVNPRLRFFDTANGPELCPCNPKHPDRRAA